MDNFIKKEHSGLYDHVLGKWLINLSIIIFSLSISSARAQVGTWKNYLAYHDIQQICAADHYLFVCASNGLYQYNKNDQSITTFDKTNGMNDVTITNIRWCQQAKRLVVVYDNSNIDLIETNGDVTNVSSIYRKVITGGKTINNVTINGQYAYLACDFGIVKLNVKKAEIDETYMLDFVVEGIAFDKNSIYALSNTQEVWTASLNNNLIDRSNWTITETFPSFEQDLTDYNQNIELVKTLQLDGPSHNKFGFMRYINNKLYTCNGDFESQVPIQMYDGYDWQIYQSEGISEKTGVSFQGAYCLDVDPTNENHLFAGARNGLYEYMDGRFVDFFNSTNSPIEPYNGKSMNRQLITGVKFDKSGNLWFLNSQAPTTALVKYADGTFTKTNHPELMKLNTDANYPNKSNGNLSNMIIDSNGLMWFCNDNWVTAAYYKYNIANDDIKAYETFVNQDGTRISIDNGVKCVVEDLNNNMWIGTSSGPFLLEKGVMNDDIPVLTQVKVPRNDGTNYADYLLAGISISSIAVDAAGRKWFGTENNGVYLISEDNIEQIHHFTTENSPLLSDVINSIAINHTSGEVFIATDKGLCSYVSDTQEAPEEMTKESVYAYPNPVTPDYTGLISIVGLTYNADVKIVSSNGALIAEGKSNGGMFTWDGNDKNGNRVASGVYMVVTATSDNKKGTVCKIAIIK